MRTMHRDLATGTGKQPLIKSKNNITFTFDSRTKPPTSAIGPMLRESHKKKLESERAFNSDTRK